MEKEGEGEREEREEVGNVDVIVLDEVRDGPPSDWCVCTRMCVTAHLCISFSYVCMHVRMGF